MKKNHELISQEITIINKNTTTTNFPAPYSLFSNTSASKNGTQHYFCPKLLNFEAAPTINSQTKLAPTRLASQAMRRKVREQKVIKVLLFPSLRNAPKMKSTSNLISFQQNISLLANGRVVAALTKNSQTYHTRSCLSHRPKPGTSQHYRVRSPKRIRWLLDRFGTNIALRVTEITQAGKYQIVLPVSDRRCGLVGATLLQDAVTKG